MSKHYPRIIIAGSRSGVKYSDVEEGVFSGLKALGIDDPLDIKCILCGMAEGVDLLGKAWADGKLVRVWEFPADWQNVSVDGAVPVTRPDGTVYNLVAGHQRNQMMVDVADAAIFIRRSGKSSGTDDCIKRARKKGIPIYIHQL